MMKPDKLMRFSWLRGSMIAGNCSLQRPSSQIRIIFGGALNSIAWRTK
jgi:hypothetical protein